jgi:hypothetical protein
MINEKRFLEEYVLSDWEVDTLKEIKHYKQMNVSKKWIFDKYKDEEIDLDLLRIMVYQIKYNNGA